MGLIGLVVNWVIGDETNTTEWGGKSKISYVSKFGKWMNERMISSWAIDDGWSKWEAKGKMVSWKTVCVEIMIDWLWRLNNLWPLMPYGYLIKIHGIALG